MNGMMNSDASRMPFLNDSCEKVNMDIKFQIQRMEKSAYYCVLRAFIAQSDLLTWEKEELITELRKELNVTDTEHGQILGKINSDESVRRIREWRKGAPESVSNNMDAPGYVSPPNRTIPALQKPQIHLSHDKPFSAMIPSLAQAQFRPDQQCLELATFPTMDPMKIVNHNFPAPLSNKHEGSSQSHLKVRFPAICAGIFKNCSDPIQIRLTDEVIHEVKHMAFGREYPDLAQLQKAMLILGEHERDILQALDKIAKVSDEGYDSHSNKQFDGSGQRMSMSSNYHGKGSRQQCQFH